MARLRIIVTGLLALAFAVGPGWTPCLAFHQAMGVASEPTSALGSHQNHAHHMHEMATDHLASAAGDRTTTDKERDRGGDNVCMKCCAACMATSVLPRSAAISAPTGSRAVFVSLNARVPARFVFVDPDIPKRVA